MTKMTRRLQARSSGGFASPADTGKAIDNIRITADAMNRILLTVMKIPLGN
jgi:hypothetical protein